MARKKQSKKSNKASKITKRTNASQKLALSNDPLARLSTQFRLSDSYVSLILGAVVVVAAVAIGVFLFKGKAYLRNTDLFNSQKPQVSVSPTPQARTYKVQEGEDLWAISEKIYGSGFNWVDIVEANNLQTPDSITTGMVLIIPNVPQRTGE